MRHTAQQHDLTWVHADPTWQDLPRIYTEYLLRRQAGQHPEIWDTLGGADGSLSGVTLLWIPEESVFWAFTCGLDPTWYYSPLTRDALLKELAEPGSPRGWFGWCSKLEHYRAWTATCAACGARLTPEDWTIALYVADGEPEMPLCDGCLKAECEVIDLEQGL